MPDKRAKKTSQKGFVAFFRRQDWEDFAMKFLAVFLGIVITFAGNAWLNHRKEKKAVHKGLELVCDELQANIEMMDALQASVETEAQAAAYLQQYQGRYGECSEDSMALYCNVPFVMPTIKPSTAALELLKSAALFQNIDDKTVSLAVIQAYNAIEDEKVAFQYYYEKKQKLLDKAMQEEANEVFSRPMFTGAEAWASITSTTEGRQFLNEIIISKKAGFGHKDTKELVSKIIKDVKAYIGE